MPFTRTTLLLIIKIAIGSLIGIAIIAFAIFGSLNYARGPVIDIVSPANESAIASTTAIIQGHADRINDLSLNGDPISVDEQGDFSETVIIFPGANALTFVAHDQFGRTTTKELDLTGTAELPVNEKATVPSLSATSTATST